MTNQDSRYLLDTNIIIGMFAGDRTIREKVQNTGKLFLASPVIGELYYGARKSNRVIENLARVDSLIRQFPLYSCGLETTQWFGIIKNQLRLKGYLIPDNDIWIAAIAMQHDLILVTRDSHFHEVESLQTERW